jgi:hypothetical protein
MAINEWACFLADDWRCLKCDPAPIQHLVQRLARITETKGRPLRRHKRLGGMLMNASTFCHDVSGCLLRRGQLVDPSCAAQPQAEEDSSDIEPIQDDDERLQV